MLHPNQEWSEQERVILKTRANKINGGRALSRLQLVRVQSHVTHPVKQLFGLVRRNSRRQRPC